MIIHGQDILSRIYPQKKEKFDRMFLGKTEEIDQVYYGEFDVMELSKGETPFEEQLAEELDSMEEIYKTK